MFSCCFHVVFFVVVFFVVVVVVVVVAVVVSLFSLYVACIFYPVRTVGSLQQPGTGNLILEIKASALRVACWMTHLQTIVSFCFSAKDSRAKPLFTLQF